MSEPFNEAVDTAGEQCNDDVAPLQNITKAQLQSTLSLAGGQMLSVARQLGQIDGWELARRVEAIIHWHDLVLLLVIALITRPLLVNLFRRPLAVVIGDIISQAAWLAMVVYAVDIVVVTLVLGGVLDIERWQFLSVGVAKIIYTVWAATRLCAIKQYLLNKWAPRLLFRVDSRVAELGENEERKVQKKALLVQKITLIDKAVDVAVYICTGFVLYDVLDVEMGVGATSVFAFGSLSTVLVGLASKDIATMFFNGIAMGVSNRIQEGDYVEFGDGTTGKIQKIGWMLTTIQHYDNTTEVIPNSMLGMQRVINLSRTTQCQLKVTLRFRYEDAGKLPEVCKSILEEIKAASPLLVSDGSKPMRAHVSGFQDYYVQVDVNTHYNCQPFGNQYCDNKHDVMMAIHKAISEKHGLKLALPPAVCVK